MLPGWTKCVVLLVPCTEITQMCSKKKDQELLGSSCHWHWHRQWGTVLDITRAFQPLTGILLKWQTHMYAIHTTSAIKHNKAGYSRGCLHTKTVRSRKYNACSLKCWPGLVCDMCACVELWRLMVVNDSSPPSFQGVLKMEMKKRFHADNLQQDCTGLLALLDPSHPDELEISPHSWHWMKECKPPQSTWHYRWSLSSQTRGTRDEEMDKTHSTKKEIAGREALLDNLIEWLAFLSEALFYSMMAKAQLWTLS